MVRGSYFWVPCVRAVLAAGRTWDRWLRAVTFDSSAKAANPAPSVSAPQRWNCSSRRAAASLGTGFPSNKEWPVDPAGGGRSHGHVGLETHPAPPHRCRHTHATHAIRRGWMYSHFQRRSPTVRGHISLRSCCFRESSSLKLG